MSWTIKGEAGKALDETVRTLTSLNVDAASLTFASLDSDRFEWTAATEDAAGTGTIIPDAGQVIEVFYNGTRRFRGHVTIPRVRTGRVEVAVEGPWWWWQRVPLTSEQTDDESNTKERPSYIFPTQSLKTSLEALIDRSIANGVPIIRGTVSTMFDFPRITLSEMSCGQALADIMSICPDAVAYYDYSGASGTNPTLNIIRRGDMTAETLMLGTDAIETIDLAPRLDLEVSSVKVSSASRNTTNGSNQFVEQSSGTPAPGKNQIIVVSGPEVNDYLPKDFFNTFDCQTGSIPSGGQLLKDVSPTESPTYVAHSPTDFIDFLKENSARLQQIKARYTTRGIYISAGGRHVHAAFSNGNSGSHMLLGKPEIKAKKSTTGHYIVISPDFIPDWALWQNEWSMIDATVEYYGYMYEQFYTSSVPSTPSWYTYASDIADRAMQGWVAPTGSFGYDYRFSCYFKESLSVRLVNQNLPTLQTIYRKWDYSYLNPPAGLADNMLAAQNWVPYEGQIVTVADEVDGAQVLQKKWNVGGGYTPHSTMAALAKRVFYNIPRGRLAVTLGAPPRTDFGTMVNRFRRNPKDNIVYL